MRPESRPNKLVAAGIATCDRAKNCASRTSKTVGVAADTQKRPQQSAGAVRSLSPEADAA